MNNDTAVLVVVPRATAPSFTSPLSSFSLAHANQRHPRVLVACTAAVMLATGSAINSRLREAARAVTNRALNKDGREDQAGDPDETVKVRTLRMQRRAYSDAVRTAATHDVN